MRIKKLSIAEKTGISDCEIIPVVANRDQRGCLTEIYRQSWSGAFPAVQWNACVSEAGVVRGAHVHADYHELYTLVRGRVVLGLADVRRNSPTFGRSAQFEWSDHDDRAIVIPIGVAHVILFTEDSVLTFGLSDYWRAEYDNIGCQWDAPEFNFAWPTGTVRRSERDAKAPSYQTMLQRYDEMRQEIDRHRRRELTPAGG